MPTEGIITVVSIVMVIATIWIIILTALNVKDRKKSFSMGIEMKPSRCFLFCGITFTLIWYAVIIYLFIVRDSNLALSILCVAASLLGTAITTFALNWRIVLQENGFVWRNCFRKKFYFEFSDITQVKTYGDDKCWVYCGKRMIAVTSLTTNYEKLRAKLSSMGLLPK